MRIETQLVVTISPGLTDPVRSIDHPGMNASTNQLVDDSEPGRARTDHQHCRVGGWRGEAVDRHDVTFITC